MNNNCKSHKKVCLVTIACFFAVAIGFQSCLNYCYFEYGLQHSLSSSRETASAWVYVRLHKVWARVVLPGPWQISKDIYNSYNTLSDTRYTTSVGLRTIAMQHRDRGQDYVIPRDGPVRAGNCGRCWFNTEMICLTLLNHTMMRLLGHVWHSLL